MNAVWNDPPAHLTRLMPGAVDVWSVGLDVAPAQVEMLGAALSPDERERAGRFHFERDRRRYICARGALRDLLARYLGADPAALTFSYGPNGKPALSGRFEGLLTFNVSHSDELALIAIGRSVELGVDVEAMRAIEDSDEIASRFFAPAEAARLRTLLPAARASAFFACWTRKEAYLKALGSGLAKPLDAFEVTYVAGETPALVVYGDEVETARWRLQALAPGAGYAGALVTQGDVDVRCWRFIPNGRALEAV